MPVVDINRGCHSAHHNINSDSSRDSPDPLEPWSTKGITNMNTILAWEDEQESN